MADDRDQRVRQRAYEIWEKEGRASGREREHWEQAEREVGGGESKPRARATGAAESAAGKKPAPGKKPAAGKPSAAEKKAPSKPRKPPARKG